MGEFVAPGPDASPDDFINCMKQLHACIEEGKLAAADANVIFSAQIKGVVGQLQALKSDEVATQALLETHRNEIASELRVHKEQASAAIAAVDHKIEMVDASVTDLGINLAEGQRLNEGATSKVDEKIENLTKAFGLTADEKVRKPKPIALMGQWEVAVKAGGAISGIFFLWKFVDFALPYLAAEFWGLVHFVVALDHFVSK